MTYVVCSGRSSSVFGHCSNCFVVVVCPFFYFFSFRFSNRWMKLKCCGTSMQWHTPRGNNGMHWHCTIIFIAENICSLSLNVWVNGPKKKVVVVARWLRWMDTLLLQFYILSLLLIVVKPCCILRNQFIRTSLPTSFEQQCVQHQICCLI